MTARRGVAWGTATGWFQAYADGGTKLVKASGTKEGRQSGELSVFQQSGRRARRASLAGTRWKIRDRGACQISSRRSKATIGRRGRCNSKRQFRERLANHAQGKDRLRLRSRRGQPPSNLRFPSFAPATMWHFTGRQGVFIALHLAGRAKAECWVTSMTREVGKNSPSCT